MGIKSFQGPLDETPFHSRNYLGTKAWACLEVMAHRAAVVLASMACEASATYQQVRPSYSVESVKFFLKTLGILEQQKAQPFSILELGTGTGKFTRVLMEARYLLRATFNSFLKQTLFIASDRCSKLICHRTS